MRPLISGLDLTRLDGHSCDLAARTLIPGLVEPLAERGVFIHLSTDIREMAKFREEAGMGFFFPPFDPRYHDHLKCRVVALFAYEGDKPIGMVGSRLYEIPGISNLSQALESLDIFYGDAASQAPSWAQCICTSPTAKQIRNQRIALSGAGFMHPEHRGHKTFKALFRLLRIAELASFPDYAYAVALINRPIYGRLHDVYGFTRVESRVYLTLPDITEERREQLICFATRAEVMSAIMTRDILNLDRPLNVPRARGVGEINRLPIVPPQLDLIENDDVA